MSDKPKVYQGVRVKTTVKELLQRRRAEQAVNEPVQTISQEFSPPEVSVSTVSAHHYYDSFPGELLDHRGVPPFSPAGSAGMGSLEEQQLLSLLLQDDGFPGGPLPALPSLQSWNHGHQATDYYGHDMDPCSPPDSLRLPSPADYSSYSPQECYSSSSSSSSSCYSSPSRLDSGYGFAPEQCLYQPCSLQRACCLSPWVTGQQDGVLAPEYPAYAPTDCAYASNANDTFYRRDLTSQEMCYL